ncbi:MAG: aminotransferase class I/II-fold pyridoxal phosphate-dependent enzyme [Sphingopyxis sp.]|uniref:aminotransferase class I/II-fold pyridoxal phosphate-dependent enzyme n=1 Tax=Sphingopyxis sp. TaxID=1908224 RepID=UPI002ABCD7B0|nr:aminotransferase class I/II-fold pyridoxal phosphate-dependent enzyme [Sphingopyxis sp.]MDZ3831474.1 aminotransferase class I/II-fold pyridoxal phosphate-dependent enzyme [Sphingopyxis sp.]
MTADWTWHGGALDAAKRRFGQRDADWIDLSTGINPAAWPGADDVAIDWRRLPESGAIAALEAAAADVFGVDAQRVCAVPGTEIGLRLVGRMIGDAPGGGAHHMIPCYRTHGEMMPHSIAVPRDEAAATEGSLLLANPTNPDGHVTTADEMRRLGARDGWLMIDEAFADTDPAISMAPQVADDRRLIVFRSFGKFFGLAGVRLGFVIAPGAILDGLRAMLGAWPVSSGAIAIGTAAYRDSGWIAAMRAALPREAAGLDALLARHGHVAIGRCPLFRLIETPHAAALFDRLAHSAILTRPFAERPDWLRIGLPADAAAAARLDAALADG